MNDRSSHASSTEQADLGPIERIREGMRVIDAAGGDIGAVEFVKMGDPGATTVGADAPRDGGFLQDIAGVFGFDSEPDLPDELRARLMRVGFIKIDGKGLTDSDRYVMADKIAGVSSDTVRLTLPKNRLTAEL